MAIKIYDIQPPKTVKKAEKELKEPVAIKRIKRTEPVHQSRYKKEKRPVWVPVSICALIVVFVVGVYLFIKLPKADIIIWPKVETLSFKQTITADKSVDSVDTVKSIIPAKFLQVTKTGSQDFPATGNASNEGYASGTITIYNKFDPVSPFTFKAGTRFISDSGKLFVASQKIVIPAAKKSGSKITPGSISVKIQAVEGGDVYNIAPSNFSVPGLKGTAYYYSIYATSTSPMTGGYAGKVKKVTDDDIQGAKDVLTKKTTSDATAALKSQVSSDYVLLDNSILSTATSASTKTKVGTTADNFNYQVTVSASALAFAKADLDQFAKDYVVSQIPEGKTLLDNSSKIDYSAGLVDVSGGKAVLNLDFSSGVYQNVDKNSLSLSMLGENYSQIEQTINSTLGDNVSRKQIKFWPFWVTSAPRNQKAVTVELKFQ